MLGGIIGDILSTFRIAVSVLLIGTLFSIAVSRLYSADENGVRIGELYRSKRAVIILVITLPLLSALAFGFFQPTLLKTFRDPRMLSSAVGLLFPLLLFRANDVVENWNLFDGGRDMVAILSLSLVLLLGPWLGPIAISYIVQRIRAFIDFVIHQVQLLITGVVHYAVSGVTSTVNQLIQSILGFLNPVIIVSLLIGISIFALLASRLSGN